MQQLQSDGRRKESRCPSFHNLGCQLSGVPGPAIPCFFMHRIRGEILITKKSRFGIFKPGLLLPGSWSAYQHSSSQSSRTLMVVENGAICDMLLTWFMRNLQCYPSMASLSDQLFPVPDVRDWGKVTISCGNNGSAMPSISRSQLCTTKNQHERHAIKEQRSNFLIIQCEGFIIWGN